REASGGPPRSARSGRLAVRPAGPRRIPPPPELRAAALPAGQRFPAAGFQSAPRQVLAMQAGRRPAPAAALDRESSTQRSRPCPPLAPSSARTTTIML